MFASIRRHQKWLWMMISAAVIISFVVFFTPDVESHFRSGGGEAAAFGNIRGREISREEARGALMEARLRYYLFSGSRTWPGEAGSNRQFDEDGEARTRLFLLDTLERFGIEPGQQAAAVWIQHTFRDQTGSFHKDSFDRFFQQTLAPRGYSLPALFRFATHEVALEHLVRLVGGAASLITPQEIERLYREENERVTVQSAFFSLSNHLESVTVEPAALSRFYTNQMARYRLPTRTMVSYVQFEADKYLAEADQLMAAETNLNATLDAIYAQRGTNYYVDSAGVPLAAATARDRIRTEVRQMQAVGAARRVATLFLDELLEMREKQPQTTDLLDQLAAAKGLARKVSEPFDDSGPRDPSLPPGFGAAGSRLTTEEPIALNPVVGTNGVYILALRFKLPSEVPALNSIQERVTTDYRRDQALEAARAAGNGFLTKATNGLAAGKNFETIAAEDKIPLIRVAAFPLSTRSIPEILGLVDVNQFKDSVETLKPGKATPFIRTPLGGFVSVVESRQAADPEVMTKELPEFRERLRISQIYTAFNEWFTRERQSSGIDALAAVSKTK